MKFKELTSRNIYAIPVGEYFDKEVEACYLVYSPLANVFYLSLPNEVIQLQENLEAEKTTPLLNKLLDQSAFNDFGNNEVSIDSFCTLHLLLNEKCNFHCKYCYSAEDLPSAE